VQLDSLPGRKPGRRKSRQRGFLVWPRAEKLLRDEVIVLARHETSANPKEMGMIACAKNVTQILLDWSQGDRHAAEQLFPLVYDELHRLAARQMRRERADHRLQATALVNEAYLRLIDQRRVCWQNRAHFFGVAAQLMRRILLKYAERRRTAKRGAGQAELPLDEAFVITAERAADLIALDHALGALTAVDERQSRIVEMRFFGGLSVEEIGVVRGVSPATVKREWRVAKAWLYGALSETLACSLG
jgi:RNA polymerase sigma factor (TIGR02999 family)